MTPLETLFSWVLTTTWQASVLALLVLAVQWTLGRRLNPRWRYALWLLVLLRLVLPDLPESALSLFRYAPAAPLNFPETIPAPVIAIPPSLSNFNFPQEVAQPQPNYTYLILALLWSTGAAGLFLLTILVNYRFARQVTHAPEITDPTLREIFAQARADLRLRRRIRLIESPHVTSPAIMGLLTPTLLLPAGARDKFDPRELRFIFLHELAHLKRGDVAVQALIALLQILHWFNPVLWYAFRRMRLDREPATDALVLSRTGEAEKEHYGLMLIKLLGHFNQRHSLPTLVGILEDKDQFKQRFSLIARFTRGAYGWSLLGVIVIGILAAVCLTKAQADAEKSPADASLLPVSDSDPNFAAALRAIVVPAINQKQVTASDALRAVQSACRSTNPHQPEVRLLGLHSSASRFDFTFAGGTLKAALDQIAQAGGITYRISPLYVYHVQDGDSTPTLHSSLGQILCTFWNSTPDEPMLGRTLVIPDSGLRLLRLQLGPSGDVRDGLKAWGIQFPPGSYATCKPDAKHTTNILEIKDTGDQVAQVINLVFAASPETLVPSPNSTPHASAPAKFAPTLPSGAEVTEMNTEESSKTPLMKAVERQDFTTAHELLDHGADVNATDKLGNTALVYLIDFGGIRKPFPVELLREMLKTARNPNPPSYVRSVPPSPPDSALEVLFMGAAQDSADNSPSDRQAATILLDHGAVFSGASGNAERLLEAATRGDLATLKQLAASGTSIDATDANGWSPLLITTALDYTDAANWLLDHGANVNAPSRRGVEDPLTFAADRGEDALVEKMIAKGAKPDLAWRALRHAVDSNDQRLFDDLVKAGVVMKDAGGLFFSSGGKYWRQITSEPLFTCIKYGQTAMGVTLLDKGVEAEPADVDLNQNYTYWAVYYDRPEILHALLQHGANPQLQTSTGETPLSLARKKHPDLLPILEAADKTSHVPALSPATSNIPNPPQPVTTSGSTPLGQKPTLNLSITVVEIEEKTYQAQSAAMNNAVASGDLAFFTGKKNVFVAPPETIAVAPSKDWYSEGSVNSMVGSIKYDKVNGQLTTTLNATALFTGLNADFVFTPQPDQSLSLDSTWTENEPETAPAEAIEPAKIPATVPTTLDFTPKMHLTKATDPAWKIEPGKVHAFWIGPTLGQFTRTSEFKDKTLATLKSMAENKTPSRLAVFLTTQPIPNNDAAQTTSLASPPTATAPAPVPATDIAATVDGHIITLEELKQQWLPAKKDLEAKYSGQQLQEQLIEAGRKIPMTLVDRQLIIDDFKAHGGFIPKSFIDERINDIIKDQYGGDRASFLQTLASRNWSEDKYRKEIEENAIVGYANNKLVGEKVDDYYDAHLDLFPADEQLRITLMEIKGSVPVPEGHLGNFDAETDPRAALAREDLQKMRAGADASTLPATEGVDPKRVGESMWVTHDRFPGWWPVTWEQVEKLKPGETTDVVVGDGAYAYKDGPSQNFHYYYIVRLEERRPAKVPATAETTEQKKALLDAERNEIRQAWLEGLRSKAKIEISDAALSIDPWSKVTQPTTPVDHAPGAFDAPDPSPSPQATAAASAPSDASAPSAASTLLTKSGSLPPDSPFQQRYIASEMAWLTQQLGLSPKQADALRAAMEAVVHQTTNKTVDQALKEILSPEQWTAWGKVKEASNGAQARSAADSQVSHFAEEFSLSPAQQEKLFEALNDAEQKFPSKVLHSDAELRVYMDHQEEAREAAMEEILTPAQILTVHREHEALMTRMQEFPHGTSAPLAAAQLTVAKPSDPRESVYTPPPLPIDQLPPVSLDYAAPKPLAPEPVTTAGPMLQQTAYTNSQPIVAGSASAQTSPPPSASDAAAARLLSIHFDLPAFAGSPLNEIVNQLDRAATQADPTQQDLSFVVQQTPDTQSARLTLHALHGVTIAEALKEISRAANLTYVLEGGAIYLRPAAPRDLALSVRTFPVPDGFFKPSTTPQTSVELELLARGITFTGDSTAVFLPGLNKLVVRDTPDALDKLATLIQTASTATPENTAAAYTPAAKNPALDQKLIGVASNGSTDKIGAGDADAVGKLLDQGADPSAKDARGTSALIWALNFGKDDAAALLIQKGADVNAMERNMPAIEAACMIYYCPNALDQLLRHGAQIPKPDAQGHSILDVLFTAGPPAAGKMNYLRDRAWTDTDFQAWVQRQRRVVDLLAAAGVDLNGYPPATPPLLHAIRNGNLELARALLAHGVKVDVRDANGDTPMSAAQQFHPEFVPELQAAQHHASTQPTPASSQTVTTAPHGIRIEMKLVEIKEDVYRAHKTRIDAAVDKGDFLFLYNLAGVSALSAPTVTTMAGLKADIDIVREFPYPTSFEAGKIVPHQTLSAPGGSMTNMTLVIPPTPREFATKDVGISAEITPTINPADSPGPGKIVLDGRVSITDFDGFTASNVTGAHLPSFTTSESNFIEQMDDHQPKAVWLPGQHVDQSPLVAANNRTDLSPAPTTERLLLFVTADRVP